MTTAPKISCLLVRDHEMTLPNHTRHTADFYATWCQGCQTIYPDLCRLAADQKYTGRVRFVKVCVEELKALAKQQGAKALPYVQLYRTQQHAPLVGFQAVPSRCACFAGAQVVAAQSTPHNRRVKALRANVDTVLQAPPDKYLRIDPNGALFGSLHRMHTTPQAL